MKSSFNKRRCTSGFSLVELLVVMGIIAILAAVVIGGISSALRFAKRTKANATAVQIQTAMQNYYTEYGVYPTAQLATANPQVDDYYDGTPSHSPGNWPALVYTLCGNANPLPGVAGAPAAGIATGANSRNIAYFTPVRSDLDTSAANPGAPLNPFGLTTLGPYYFMVVDTDYSNIAGDSGTGTAKILNFSGKTVAALNAGVPGGVAVWCSCDQALTGSKSAWWAHTY